MIILGIETSCDETAAAVAYGNGDNVEIFSSAVSSQIDIHKKYGGIVPEVAAREHVVKILPIIDEALGNSENRKPSSAKAVAGKQKTENPPPLKLWRASRKQQGLKSQSTERRTPNIDAIAVTYGPGLITSLMVGVETAKTLSYVWNIPLIAVNHLEGHIYANFIGIESQVESPKSKVINFPAIILIVSGGHTSLVLMNGHGKYKAIGETVDDAAGEAFDKAAKLLGIGYPGGPAISKRAEEYNNSKFNPPAGGQNSKLSLPRPMINSRDCNFSFSGLKTALLYKLRGDKDWEKKIPEYAFEFQQAVIDVLVAKTITAAKKFNAKTIMLGGGVTANQGLREQIKIAAAERLPQTTLLIPNLDFTTDNAAMIAAAGYFKAKAGEFTDWKKIKVDCNASL